MKRINCPYTKEAMDCKKCFAPTINGGKCFYWRRDEVNEKHVKENRELEEEEMNFIRKVIEYQVKHGHRV